MTLLEAIGNKSGGELSEAHSFWETGGDSRALPRRIGDSLFFLERCAALTPDERAILLHLMREGEPGIRGDIERIFGTSAALGKLVERLFIYVRMDRALLTDRTDKIYLFPEVSDILKGIPLLDEEQFSRRMKKAVGSGRFSSLQSALISGEGSREGEDAPSADMIVALARMGGFIDFRNGFPEEYRALLEGDYLRPLLVHDSASFVPLLAVHPGALHAAGKPEREAHFNQSLYMSDLLKLSDCLTYRSLNRRHLMKTFTECVKISTSGTERDRYYRDALSLGLIDREGNRPLADQGFALLPYAERILRVDSLMSPLEKRVYGYVKKGGCAGRISLLASFVFEERLKGLFEKTPRDEDPSVENAGHGGRAVEDVEESVESLLFRGCLVSDQSGTWVRYNDRGITEPEKGSIILSNDLEIVVFPELVSFYTLNLLAEFSSLADSRETIRLKLNRRSVLRGISLHGRIETFTHTLRACAKVRIEPALIETIEEWASTFASVSLEHRLVINVPTEEARVKLLHSGYIRKHIQWSSGGVIVFLPDTDIDRLRREIRKENVFILTARTPEWPVSRDHRNRDR
jgi:hypothetical protein